MKVDIRLMGHDLPVARYTALHLDDNASVKDALVKYLSENEIGIDLKELSKSQFIVNKKHCHLQEILHEDDMLTVIRYLGGG